MGVKLRNFGLVILLQFFWVPAFSQEFCPGNNYSEVMDSVIVPKHLSHFFGGGQNCWVGLTEFQNVDSNLLPEGIDIKVIITAITGKANGVVEFSSNTVVKVGDVFTINATNGYRVRLKHIDTSGLSCKLILEGTPKNYNESYKCTRQIAGITYTADCINYGYYFSGKGVCYTCDKNNNAQVFSPHEITISPIPVENIIQIKNTPLGANSAEIYDMCGKLIFTQKMDSNTDIHVGFLRPGCYVIHLTNELNPTIPIITKQFQKI